MNIEQTKAILREHPKGLPATAVAEILGVPVHTCNTRLSKWRMYGMLGGHEERLPTGRVRIIYVLREVF